MKKMKKIESSGIIKDLDVSVNYEASVHCPIFLELRM